MGGGAVVVRRRLGRTRLELTPLGFGAFKIGRNEKIKYAQGYALPDEAQAERLLRRVRELGIHYVDTAPAYGLSEQRVGRALGGDADVVISTKVGEQFDGGASRYDFSEAGVRASVDRSRRALRRDRLDLVFVHAHAADVEILRDTPVVATLCELRARGVIEAIGLSGKTVAAAEMALAWADALMVEYHLNDRTHEGVMEAAGQAGVGVVVKKALASGGLPADEALRFALAGPAVTSVVVGSLSAEHLAANVRAAAACA